LLHKLADTKHHLGIDRQFGVRPAEIFNNFAKFWYHENHNAKEGYNGYRQNDHRIGHGAFNLFTHAGILLHLAG
jgi:hypothetical protein